MQYPADVVNVATRERIEALLDEALGWTGNGLCDGSESGSGRVDFLCAVVDTQAAVETIVTKLRITFPSFVPNFKSRCRSFGIMVIRCGRLLRNTSFSTLR